MSAVTPNHAAPRIVLGSGFQAHYVREVADAYARLGLPVEVIGGNMHAHLQFAPGVRFCNLRGNDKLEKSPVSEIKKLANYYVRLMRHVRQSKSSGIYDVSIGRPILRCMLMYSAFRLMGKRIVYTAHNVLPHDRDTRLNRIIFWAIYRIFANAIVVHGQSIKDRIVSEFNVDARKVTVIPHGTYHPCDDTTISKHASRERLGLSQSARVVLFFGLQRPYKGTHFAIDALMGASIKNLLILIRGEATNPIYGKELKATIAAASLCLAIDSRLEPIPDSEMELLFKASDIVALPYLEGSQSGIKYMAYAYGRPVLASNVGSLSDGVISGVTGETFECGDAASFLRKLEHMMNNLDLYDEGRIRAMARDEFSFEAAVRKVERLFDEHSVPPGATACGEGTNA
ncbi:MAG: glycosyltransferase family 4 protein [Candidatus Hydrogenedentes bacterium]|nr:glycosyltransferase family 4 protein [Candidatus Hydrogenedentota bacterium]